MPFTVNINSVTSLTNIIQHVSSVKLVCEKNTRSLVLSGYMKIPICKSMWIYTIARGSGGHAPTKKMIKWCNLVHSGHSKVPQRSSGCIFLSYPHTHDIFLYYLCESRIGSFVLATTFTSLRKHYDAKLDHLFHPRIHDIK